MEIRIGTSGFSYEDWRGYFYPEGLPKNQMLAFYGERFPVVEVNATYYALPSATTIEQMARKVPADFEFVVKANKEMTHAEEFQPAVFPAFRAALEPLLRRGTLGCVLAQFPWSFRNTPPNHDLLRRFRDAMDEIPTVIEFRNAGWAVAETFALLRELELGYCCVDEPHLKGLMPGVVVATAPIGYVRFHGRNAAKWWRHEHAYERYNYLYSEEELAEWVPRIRALADETANTYVFFNNHYEGKAGQNAQMMARLLNLALPLAAV